MGFNLKIFLMEMANSGMESLGTVLLSFPDLDKMGLSGISSAIGMLGLAVGLIILGIFILTKIIPSSKGAIQKLPGLGKSTLMSGLTWKEFFLYFTLILAFISLFAGKITGTGIRDTFVGKKEHIGQSYNNETKEYEKKPIVDITIEPLQGIRFGRYYFNNKGEKISADQPNGVEPSGTQFQKNDGSIPICGYNVKKGTKYFTKSIDEFEGDKSVKKCKYQVGPNNKYNHMMIVKDSFSIAGNISKLKPIPVYISNDYDGAMNSGKKDFNNDFNVKNSIDKQKNTRAIISVLRNVSGIINETAEEADSDFGNIYASIVKQLEDLENNLLKEKNENFYNFKKITEKKAESVSKTINEAIEKNQLSIKYIQGIIENGFDEKTFNEIKRNKEAIERKIDAEIEIAYLNKGNSIFEIYKKDIERNGNKKVSSSVISYLSQNGQKTAKPVSQYIKEKCDGVLSNCFSESDTEGGESIEFKIKNFIPLTAFYFREGEKYSEFEKREKKAKSVYYSISGENNFTQLLNDIEQEKGSNKENLKDLQIYINNIDRELNSLNNYLPGLIKGEGQRGASIINGKTDNTEKRLRRVINALKQYYITCGVLNGSCYGDGTSTPDDSKYKQMTSDSNLKTTSRIFLDNLSKGNKLNDFELQFNFSDSKGGEEIESNDKDDTSLRSLVFYNFKKIQYSLYGDPVVGDFNKMKNLLQAFETKKIINNNFGGGELATEDGYTRSITLNNERFTDLEKHTGEFSKYYNSIYKDLTNIPGSVDGATTAYIGITDEQMDGTYEEDMYFGVWNSKEKLEESKLGMIGKAYSSVLKATGLKNDFKDPTFITENDGDKKKNPIGLTIMKGDIIFGSVGTVIMARPYPITLRMDSRLAKTIEFIDENGAIVGYYSDRYKNENGKKIKVASGDSEEIGEINPGGIYYTFGTLFGKGGANWLFDPVRGLGVIEFAGGNTPGVLIFYLFSMLFYLLFSVRLIYMVLFILLIPIVIWGVLIPGLDRITKRLLAIFIGCAVFPIFSYLIMSASYAMFGNDITIVYEIRNFSMITFLIFFAMVIFPPIFSYQTYRAVYQYMVTGKVDRSAIAFGELKGVTEGKVKAEGGTGGKNNSESKNEKNKRKEESDKLGGIEDMTVSVNDFEDENNKDLSLMNEKQDNIHQKGGYIIGKGDLVSDAVSSNHKTELFDDMFIGENIKEKVEVEYNGIDGRTLLGLMYLRNQSELSKLEIARSLSKAFGDNKKQLSKIAESLNVIEKQGLKDPKLNNAIKTSQGDISRGDAMIMKKIEESNGGKINKKILEKERKEIFDRIKKDNNSFTVNDVNKLKALKSYEVALDGSEDSYKNITKSISRILKDKRIKDQKNLRGNELEKRIAELISKGDSEGLNDFKNQHQQIQGINEYIESIKIMPHKMLNVLHQNLSSTQMLNSSEGIDKFLGYMRNSSELQKLKDKNVEQYLSTVMLIDKFKSSDMESKIQLATRSSMGSIDSIRRLNESNKMTEQLSNSIIQGIKTNGIVNENNLKEMIGGMEIQGQDALKLRRKIKSQLQEMKELS